MIMNNKIRILVLALLLPLFSFSQITKEREVTATAGDYAITPSYQISWTVGDVAVNTIQTGNLIVTEGFQQNDINITAISEIEFSGEISLFPNPVNDMLNFEVRSEEDMDLIGELFDATGKKVLEIPRFSVYSAYQGQLDFSNLPAGNWFLKFHSKVDDSEKTFKIVKLR